MKNEYVDNDMLFRNNRDVILFKSTNNNVDNIIKIINDNEKYYDHVLHFNGGVSAELIKEQSVIGKLSNNVMSIYNTTIHNLLIKIKELLIESCNKYEINVDKTKFYLSSEYIDGVDSNAWYDTGGVRAPCFSGIIVLDCSSGILKIGKEKINVSKGDIVLFESGHRITYEDNSIKIISFVLSPISLLDGQYPQKWIPIL